MIPNVNAIMEIEPSWEKALHGELEKPYMRELMLMLEEERRGSIPIYPPATLIFNAFWKTPFNQVKVVILGQDPYHGEGQAHGLCFSVPAGVPPPPSLVNIFKELNSDLGIPIPKTGSLVKWTEQGVFLLNTTLTVRQGTPLSHHGRGWERFTDAVIAALAAKEQPLVFILWGKSAQDKCKMVLKDNMRHLILKAPHPSPFSAHSGFLGSKPFSQTNQFLEKHQIQPINWSLS